MLAKKPGEKAIEASKKDFEKTGKANEKEFGKTDEKTARKILNRLAR